MTAFTSRTSNCLYAAIDWGKSSATRARSAPGKRSSRAAAAASMRRSSSTYSGISWREGSSSASMPTRPRRSGPALEQEPEGLEPSDDVLRRIGAVDPEDHRLGPRGDQLALAREHRFALSQARELVRIDRDRMRRHERAARVEAQARAGREKRASPALGVEADDVVGEQPAVDRRHDRGGQHRPGLGVHPGMWVKWASDGLGALRPDERGRDVEVVVVEEDGRRRLALELLEDGVGEGPVHRHVALLPGAAEVVVRVVLELPEAVLDEPERGVRDDVVVEVVRGRPVRDEPQPVARAVAGGLLDGALGGDRAVLVRERARDPGDVVVRRRAARARSRARRRRVAPRARHPRRARTRADRDSRRRSASAGQTPTATLRKELHEAEPRPAAVRAAADLDLVGDRPDDRDPEATLGELGVFAVPALRSPARSRCRRRRPRRSDGRRRARS